MKQKMRYFISLIAIIPVLVNAGTDKLTVALNGQPIPNHGPIIIAQQLGYFAEQGLSVRLLTPANPRDSSTQVALKKADIGIAHEPDLIQQIDNGEPLVTIGTLIDKPLTSVVVLKESKMQTLADLKGKTIAASNKPLSAAMLKIMLRKAGISVQDVTLSQKSNNLTQALLTHEIEAISGVMRNREIPILESLDQHITMYFPEDYGIPVYNELVFVSHTSQQKDARFPRFLAAIKKAVRYIDEHPELAWKQFTKAYPETKNPINHTTWFATLPYFAENPEDVDINEWRQFAKFMQDEKLIKTTQPNSRYIVNYSPSIQG
jgi:putative hydroxymethylpyrimidine transport system substrate-binding protein